MDWPNANLWLLTAAKLLLLSLTVSGDESAYATLPDGFSRCQRPNGAPGYICPNSQDCINEYYMCNFQEAPALCGYSIKATIEICGALSCSAVATTCIGTKQCFLNARLCDGQKLCPNLSDERPRKGTSCWPDASGGMVYPRYSKYYPAEVICDGKPDFQPIDDFGNYIYMDEDPEFCREYNNTFRPTTTQSTSTTTTTTTTPASTTTTTGATTSLSSTPPDLPILPPNGSESTATPDLGSGLSGSLDLAEASGSGGSGDYDYGIEGTEFAVEDYDGPSGADDINVVAPPLTAVNAASIPAEKSEFPLVWVVVIICVLFLLAALILIFILLKLRRKSHDPEKPPPAAWRH